MKYQVFGRRNMVLETEDEFEVTEFIRDFADWQNYADEYDIKAIESEETEEYEEESLEYNVGEWVDDHEGDFWDWLERD